MTSIPCICIETAVQGSEMGNRIRGLKVASLLQVTDGVYVAVGFALANSILIDGPEGLIVVDTTESPEAAAAIYQEFRHRVPNKPIKAIVYTHNHPDHLLGTPVRVSDRKCTYFVAINYA